MARVLPVKKIERITETLSQIMNAHPDADISFLMRGQIEVNNSGAASLGVAADPSALPIDTRATVDLGRRFDQVGVNEFVLTIERQAMFAPLRDASGEIQPGVGQVEMLTEGGES